MTIEQYRVPPCHRPLDRPARSRPAVKLASSRAEIASIITARTLSVSATLSIVYHLALLAFLGDRIQEGLPEFWEFLLCDSALLALALVPPVAVGCRRLAWHDPITILSILFTAMTSLFSLGYFIDPEFMHFYASYDGTALLYVNEAEFLALAAQSELIFVAFFAVLLFTNNRRPIPPTNAEFSRQSYRLAFWSTAFCLLAGAFGFVSYWTPSSFLQALTSGIGKPQIVPDWGTSRYLLLVSIGSTSLSLGMVGFLGLIREPKAQALLANILIPLAGLTVALLNLWNGARSDAILAFLTVLIVGYQFGYRISRVTWLLMGILAVVPIAWATILRANFTIPNDPLDATLYVLSGKALQVFFEQIGSPVVVLLSVDRVSVMAMVLAYLNGIGAYLHGESVVGGPFNLIADLASRVVGEGHIMEGPLSMASRVITVWRYGHPTAFGGVPPSLPGEFFMQFGLPSLLILSYVFGQALFWARMKIAAPSSLLQRWFLIVSTINLIKLLTAELSVFVPIFAYTILPVPLVYCLVAVASKSAGKYWRGRHAD